MPDDPVQNQQVPTEPPQAPPTGVPEPPLPPTEPPPPPPTPTPPPMPEPPPPTSPPPVQPTVPLTQPTMPPQPMGVADQPAVPPQTPPGDQATGAKSRKKALVGITAAILVIAIFSGAAYFAIFRNQPPQEPETATRVQLSPARLTVESPTDQLAVTISEVQVKGKAAPNSFVTAYTDNNQQVFDTDASGNFAGTLTLDEGPNDVTFVSYGDNNEEKTETRSIVYVKNEQL